MPGAQGHLIRFLICVTALAAAFCTPGTCAENAPIAAAPASAPTADGPLAQSGKHIAVIMADMRNGGIVGVYREFEAAARVLGWELFIFNGEGDPRQIRQHLKQSIQQDIDGIVLVGADAAQVSDLLAVAARWHLPVVGWHAAAEPGPTDGLLANIATATYDVARSVVDYTINNSSERIGVVLIGDSRFAVSNRKIANLSAMLAECARCDVLSTEDVPIAAAAQSMPPLVRRLGAQFGRRWTHTIAINDIYFDHINAPLMEIRRRDIRNIAAGDGSASALARISGQKSAQIATIAEPLDLQGWQIADALHRAFAGAAQADPSSRPLVLDAASLAARSRENREPFKLAYAAEWRRPPRADDTRLIVEFPHPEVIGDHRADYPIHLLQHALDAAGVRYLMRPSRYAMTQSRAFTELDTGSLSVTWSMTSIEREAAYRPVRIPIDKGLFGWRIPLVRRDSLARFEAVRTLSDLKQIEAGQGFDWPDLGILKAQGFAVTPGVDAPRLAKMLAARRFDWFPRALPEIWHEAVDGAADDLVVEPTLAIHYPTAIYYFVRADNSALAEAIESGLERCLRDGTFERMFQQEHGEAIQRARLANRRIFELGNPLLPAATPLSRKVLWFAPESAAPAP
ncbi:hypothetical protein GCM10025771_00770 [Niveibacterium umoris]|uniref:ABC-type sugar transport system substrate-binding protein n=1 Tax=Niveibacterium umoris TaxID=1193620 RepID=A0A840BLD9_9RHOO|nr:substrate-binding domain-containing protein [Niveibacterium umoris]MBB4014381.1 ABC-type sugar transport system substrate-binding protein [Niveibacterium umoris]